MRWLRRLRRRLFHGPAQRVEEVEQRTELAAQEAERVKKMIENYRRAQEALRR